MIERAESQRTGPSKTSPGEEPPFEEARGIENGPPGLHLQAPISTVVHVETVLGRQHGEAVHRHSLAVAGNLHLPELRCEIAIRGHARLGNANGPGEERRATATIIRRNFQVPVPLQCLESLPREGRDLWVLTPTADRDPRWIEHYAGQLDGEPLTFDYHVPVEAALDLSFTTGGSENGGWSNVEVSGELRFVQPTRIRLRFRDSRQTMAPSSDSEGEEVLLITPGSGVPIRQTMPSPTGCDEWLTVRVIEAETQVIRVEQRLSGSPALGREINARRTDSAGCRAS
jgi:hypothetical protein